MEQWRQGKTCGQPGKTGDGGRDHKTRKRSTSKMKRIGPKVVAVLLALAMAFSPSVMAMAEARSERQPIMPTPIEGSAFEEAVEIAEEFLQRNPDGTLTLNMPRRVIRTIGEDVYAQLQAGLAVVNEKVSGGYLKFDENFDAYVTEKYLDKVKANVALHQQSLTQEELQQLGDISVSTRSGNSITVDFGILAGGGVNQVTWHWWGFRIYWSSETVDGILQGTIAISTALIAIGITVGIVGQVVWGGIIAILGTLAGGAGAYLAAVCDGYGVRLTFRWFPPPVGLVAVQPQ